MKFQIISLIIATFLTACPWSKNDDARHKALSFSEQKKYEQAIHEYRKHISARLAIKNRPKWENPYIYLLDIGDLYLEQGLVDKALAQYLEADQKGIKKAWVNDRLRQVANWYEENNLLNEAIEHLKKYRERDELLFDLMLNRMAKKLVEIEETSSITSSTNS